MKKTAPSKTDQLFRRLGLHTPPDFVVHLPLRYEDETQIHRIAALKVGQSAQVEGTIIASDVQYRPRRRLTAVIEDATGRLALRWLHFYPNQQKQLQRGAHLRVRGEVRQGYNGLEIIHPRVTKSGTPLAKALTPIYPSTQGLRQEVLRQAIANALQTSDLSDTLPPTIRQGLQLMPFADAIRFLHNPPPQVVQEDLLEKAHPAWQRIKFDELLAQQLALAKARAERHRQNAFALSANTQLEQQLRQQLPFALTQAQERAWAEIRHDLAQASPMHRLLQGDVGSGKTVIAALAAAQAIANDVQVAIMAPTEILAEQHLEKMRPWFEALGVNIAWLSGSQRTRERESSYAAIENNEAQLIIGTQALIQEKVNFKRLGLVITDEQHRFGVGQRLALSQKGQETGQKTVLPHQLSMSATPIPRTLAMSFLADLDVSTIDELPPGRSPVITKLANAERRDEVVHYVHNEIRAGKQAYWVCPLVEESEALQLETAVDTFEWLQQALPNLNVGLVHGKLKSAEKAATMEAFRSGAIQLLVATTVIEVGVDVPNATLMVIEHAERFGLAQLHQLRGRVGRGGAQSYCVLLYQPPLSEIAQQRLKAMYETTDGFEIARRDLEQRGPGEFLGTRQSGLALLRFANIETDQRLLENAKQLAIDLPRQYPEAANAHLRRWMAGKEALLRS